MVSAERGAARGSGCRASTHSARENSLRRNIIRTVGSARLLASKFRFELGVAALLLATLPLGLGSRPIGVTDEAREAAIISAMSRSGQFLEPRLAGALVPEKPFLFYAISAKWVRTVGALTPVSVRLPSALFSALTVLFTALLGRNLYSPRCGLLAAALLSTTYLFFVNAHDCLIDTALAASITAGLYLFVRASKNGDIWNWSAGVGAAAAAALLFKGVVGLGLLAIFTICLVFADRDTGSREPIRVSPFALLLPLFAIVVWGWADFRAGGAVFLRGAAAHQFGRFFGSGKGDYLYHRAPIYFYLLALPGLLAPWCLSIPAAVKRAVARRAEDPRSFGLFLGLATAIGILSLASTKRTVYLLPCAPLVALLISQFYDSDLLERERPPRWFLLQAGFAALFAAAAAILPELSARSWSPGAAAAAAALSLSFLAVVVLARRTPGGLLFASVVLALGGLLLLDRFALPRLKTDDATRDFLSRLAPHLKPGIPLYYYDPNEDVLGRLCLDLPRDPVPEYDLSRSFRLALTTRSLLLAESSKLERASEPVPAGLTILEVGKMGNKRVVLLALRPVSPN